MRTFIEGIILSFTKRTMIEVEMRAKLPDNAKKTLDNLPDIQKSHTTHYQNDIYLKHTKDVDRNLVIRFRKNDTNDVLLTFKGKPSTNDDTARPEYEMKITQYEQLLQLLLSSGYERLVVIDKSRQTYTYYNMEINIDDVKGLGLFIEVEIIVPTEDDIPTAKKTILAFLKKIGIDEKEIVNQGYVPLCIAAGIK